jgi:predicted nucleic acid-binding Zn ribbon protein
VSAATCPGCGAPLRAGAQFCSYCGREVLAPAAAPLSSSAATVPAAPAPPTGTGPVDAPRRTRSRRIVRLIVVLVVIAIVVGAAVLYYESVSPGVEVSTINVWSNDNVCGLGANLIGYNGFSGSPGASESFGFEVPNFNGTACTVDSVATNTSGFSLTDVGVPLAVPGSGTNYLNLTIVLPGSDFTGALNLIYG